MFCELELVVLTRDHPERGLLAGDVGTVIGTSPSGKRYDVEFSSPGGYGAGVLRVHRSYLRPVGRHEIFHVRTVGPIPRA